MAQLSFTKAVPMIYGRRRLIPLLTNPLSDESPISLKNDTIEQIRRNTYLEHHSLCGIIERSTFISSTSCGLILRLYSPPDNAPPPTFHPLRRRRLCRQNVESSKSPHSQANLRHLSPQGTYLPPSLSHLYFLSFFSLVSNIH